jgi:hypothetical protein
MKVAIYARGSMANNGQDPTMQTRELRLVLAFLKETCVEHCGHGTNVSVEAVFVRNASAPTANASCLACGESCMERTRILVEGARTSLRPS